MFLVTVFTVSAVLGAFALIAWTWYQHGIDRGRQQADRETRRQLFVVTGHLQILESALLELNAELVWVSERHRPLTPIEALELALIEQGLDRRPDPSDESA
jgi:hypothetical protein